jgi:hypothetical protein
LINLSTPASTAKNYAVFEQVLVGPFDPSQSSPGDVISFRADVDSLSEGMKLYHETNVAHLKTEGDFIYHPAIESAIASPTSVYPRQISFPAYIAGTTTPTTAIAPHGLGSSGAMSYNVSSTSGIILVENGDAHNFEILRVAFGRIATSPGTSLRTITKIRIWLGQRTGSSLQYHYHESERTYNASEYITSWYELVDNAPLMRTIWIEGTNEKVLTSAGTKTTTIYESRTQSNMSVQSFRGWINTKALTDFEDLEFPLKGLHFGELAQTASQKVNRNQVNMIAFLRDLKNPKSLIPKLKNLHRLKTTASNFLAIDYGILPTIDDLKSIIAAFNKAKPYIDKNGFSTFNASHSDSSTQNGTTFRLEQRIKIAIEDEDNEFVKFANSVESSGFSPTLENIWDLIPYSFVLDWFINIGDFLERVDTRLRLSRLNIRYATMSQKYTKTRTFQASPSYPFVGTISMVQYSRWTSDQCPVPPLFFQNTPTVSNHWLEASALIIQRTK